MDTKIINIKSKSEIHLSETNDIDKLKNEVLLLAMNGLGYSQLARDIQDKIKKLKKKNDTN